MSNRAETYAREFDEHSRQIIAAVEGYSPAQMQARCAGEQCTVAALASHIADVHVLVGGWIEQALAGEPLPQVTMDDVHAVNGEQFARDATRSKDEVLTSLREKGAYASGLLHGIEDSQLDQPHYFKLADGPVTTEWLVRDILIGDIAGHSASIRAACGETAGV